MYVETGYIDADDKVAFRIQAEACNCFGHSYKQWYRGIARHPVDPELSIWFPKLYENDDWQNSISDDGDTFYEYHKYNNAEHVKGLVEAYIEGRDIFKRLVFAHERDASGVAMYRFKGLYEADVETSISSGKVTYRRKTKRVKTYAPAD
jgi:hypothetical protein